MKYTLFSDNYSLNNYFFHKMNIQRVENKYKLNKYTMKFVYYFLHLLFLCFLLMLYFHIYVLLKSTHMVKYYIYRYDFKIFYHSYNHYI